MIDAKFPEAKTIGLHLASDQDFKTKDLIIGNNTNEYYIEHKVASKIANTFANRTVAPIAIKALVTQSMRSALGRNLLDHEGDLVESISASMARLAEVEPENVDMRAA